MAFLVLIVCWFPLEMVPANNNNKGEKYETNQNLLLSNWASPHLWTYEISLRTHFNMCNQRESEIEQLLRNENPNKMMLSDVLVTFTWSPAFGPSVWKRIGRQRLSSFIKLEFWKWAISATFPWIRAYVRVATFSLLNFSHFFPLKACKFFLNF